MGRFGVEAFGQTRHQRSLVLESLGLLSSRFGNEVEAGKGSELTLWYW